MTQDIKCDLCNDSGKVEVETVHFGRPYMKDGELVHDMIGRGDWHLAQCPCVGEEDYLVEQKAVYNNDR